MPLVQKGNAKATGKGKGRGKGKAKAKAKAKSGRPAKAPAVEGEAGEIGAVAVFEKVAKVAGGGALRKKVMAELETKGIDQVLAEAKSTMQEVDAKIEEAASLEEAQKGLVDQARHEFEAAKAEVELAMKAETEAAQFIQEQIGAKSSAMKGTQEDREELMEATKKLTMLEVMATSFKLQKMANDSKKAAVEAAANAKKAMQDQRQREKDALEATKRALAEARGKRIAAADAGSGKVAKTSASDEQHTPPVADGQRADDID